SARLSVLSFNLPQPICRNPCVNRLAARLVHVPVTICPIQPMKRLSLQLWNKGRQRMSRMNARPEINQARSGIQALS
ncbi:MAG TPA: hypothetical protein VHO91_00430, partial [Rhodopila sp.]|nr:hypothetical protein [Rhodopila sp.]